MYLAENSVIDMMNATNKLHEKHQHEHSRLAACFTTSVSNACCKIAFFAASLSFLDQNFIFLQLYNINLFLRTGHNMW